MKRNQNTHYKPFKEANKSFYIYRQGNIWEAKKIKNFNSSMYSLSTIRFEQGVQHFSTHDQKKDIAP
jgi:hypothetical protein